MSVTIVAIDFLWHDLTGYAIQRSLEHVDAAEVLVISDKEIFKGAKHISRPPVANMTEYANIMLKEVAGHITTDHALYVQWDGIANDKTMWTDDFLRYDYIGAVWPNRLEGGNMGNGGFSLRSKRLLDTCLEDRIQPPADQPSAEDNAICILHREYLESKGIKYAPTALAKQFSFETGLYQPSFGFHGLWNVFNLMTDADIDYFMERINFKNWNFHKWFNVITAVSYKGRYDLLPVLINELMIDKPEFWPEIERALPTALNINYTRGLSVI